MKKPHKRLSLGVETLRRLDGVRGGAFPTTGPDCVGQSNNPTLCDLCPHSAQCSDGNCVTRQASCGGC